MQTDRFPEQCGVGVVTNFHMVWDYSIAPAGGYTKPTKDDLLECIDECRGENNGMIMATVNYDQISTNPELIPLLQEVGFKCLTTFENPNSGNQVWIWWKMLTRAKRKPTRAKRAARTRTVKGASNG